jgi:hypothetical protein
MGLRAPSGQQAFSEWQRGRRSQPEISFEKMNALSDPDERRATE